MIRFPIASDAYLNERIAKFARDSAPVPRVLDVGAGKGKYHPLLGFAGELALVDAWADYLDDRMQTLRHLGPTITPMLGQAGPILATLRDGSFDVALAIDFIEHVRESEGLALIQHMKRVASRVAIFTPYGLFPQDRDHEGLGADFWQTHRSAWMPETLEGLGFTVEVWDGFHEWARDRYGNVEGWQPHAIWAAWERK